MASPTASMTTRPWASIARRWRRWARQVGWETLLNRSGTTFRKLPDADKTGLTEAKAHRPDAGPALDDQAPGAGCGRQLIVGFKPETYAARLAERPAAARIPESRGGASAMCEFNRLRP